MKQERDRLPSTAMTAERLWHQAKRQIESSMSFAAKDAWLPLLRPVGLNGNVFTIAVPDDFSRHWLEDHCGHAVSQSLSDMLRRSVRATFVVDSHPQPAPLPARPEAPQRRRRPQDEFASLPLNEKYTFDTFVVGSCNRLAHAAAMNVAKSAASSYNPLFIYGGVGLGKTHLTQAIGQLVIKRAPEARVVYISGETFLNHVVTAIREDTTRAFRSRYRNIDYWLVDDIQFIASRGATRTEVEFFHTFNTLYETGKQIVITSDRRPRDLQIVDQRLRTRFEMGLLCDIKMPDEETRCAILQKCAELDGVTVPDDVVRYISEIIDSNVRTLEGALKRVIATASLTDSPISAELASECLVDFTIKKTGSRLSPDAVLQVAADHFGLQLDDLKGPRRNKAVVFPRQLAMHLIRELTAASLTDIGQAFGGRDHTTVMHSLNKIEGLLDSDPQVAGLRAELVDKIRQTS